jgi:hypothetical protein
MAGNFMFGLTAWIALLVASSFLPQGSPTQYLYETKGVPKPYSDQEAYRVYEAVLPLDQIGQESKTLIIRAETEPYRTDCVRPDEQSKRVVASAIADYDKINKQKWILQRSFHIDKPYEVLTEKKIAGLRDDVAGPHGGWEGLEQHYPGAYGEIELSAVGFNPEKTIAIVYIGHYCGVLCGGGEFHVLQKEDGRWKLLKWGGETCGWVS